jgi:hypothetical protein
MLLTMDEVEVFLDGNQWCAMERGFTNLAEDAAGFGDMPELALNDLNNELERYQ